MVPGFLNFPSMYFIRLARVWPSSLLLKLRTCVASGPLPAASCVLERLVRYSMLRASAWFFSALLPEYAYQSPILISVSLMLYVKCENFHCSWVILRPL